MSFFYNQYLREVLGIKRYLPLKTILEQRVLRKRWPCEALAVVFHSLSSEEKSVLKKIMKSISISDFSILEIKNNEAILEQLEQALTQKLTSFIILFNENVDCEIKNILKTYSLDQFLGKSPEVQKKKQQLWLELQRIKESRK